MKFYCLMAIILAISFANSQEIIEDYDYFLNTFPRNFAKGSAEYIERRQIFNKKVKQYKDINDNPASTYKVKTTNCSDKTDAQVASNI